MFNFFQRSLRNTLSGIIALVAAIATAATGFLAYNSAYETVREMATDQLEAIAVGQEQHLATVLMMRMWQLEQIAANSGREALAGKSERAAIQEDLKREAAAGNFNSLRIADSSGRVLYALNQADIGQSLAGEPWFRAALDQASVGDLRRAAGRDDGMGEFRVTVPIFDPASGRAIGVAIGYGLSIRLYAALTDTAGRGKTGESYLMNRDGLLLSPSRFVPDSQFRLKNSGGAFQQFTQTREEGTGIWADYRGAEVLGAVAFTQLQDMGLPWAVVAEVDTAQAFAPAYTLRNFIMVITLLLVLAAMAIGYWVARSISLPVQQLAAAADRIGKGDLSANLGELDRADEIGVLHVAFRSMVGGLRDVIGNIRAGVGNLSTSSAEIATTAQQSAASAAEQASTVAEVSTTAEEIKQTSLAAAQSAQAVVAAAEQAVETGARGLDAIGDAVGTMQTIAERVNGIAQQILRLSEQTSQIGEIVEAVGKFAEQSNLLAVNASIEAAKAGEHGRGFSVVASEVRSLAEQSRRAAQQIRGILGDIQKSTQSAVMAAEEGTKRAEDGRQAIDAVRAVVEELANVLESSADKARQIAGAAGQQAGGVGQIAGAMDAVAQSGRDAAAGARQLETAAAGLRALAEQLSASINHYRM